MKAHLVPTIGDAPLQPAMDATVAALKEAICALNASIGLEPLLPQVVSRRLGLDKNLTWKVMRIVRSSDSAEALSLVPGSSGTDIYLRAFEKAGAPAAGVATARSAIDEASRLTATRIGSRNELGTVLDGLRRDGQLEQSRRLAFRGLSGVFGVQAKLRLTAQIIAPPPGGDERSHHDLILLVGLVGLRRNRAVDGLPLFRFAAISNPGAEARDLAMRPLLENEQVDPRLAWILQDFTTIPSHAVRPRGDASSQLIELGDGPIGNSGSGDVCFGARVGGVVSVRRAVDDLRLEFATAIRVPSESVVTDIFVPTSLTDALHATSEVYGVLSAPLPQDAHRRKQVQLPISPRVYITPVSDAAIAIDVFPRYPELVRVAFAAAGLDPNGFRCVRVQMDYPPCPSEVLVGWDLSE